MLNKVLSYQKEALKKPVYLCAAILDPRAKTNEINEETLNAAGLADKDDLISFFTKEAREFETTHDPDIQIIHPPSSDDDDEDDRPQHFRSKRAPISVDNEI